MSSNHCERIHWFLIPSSSAPTILGFPWLALHNPQINWSTSVACHSCLCSPLPPAPLSSCFAPVTIDLSAVPGVYHNIGEVFSKQRALPLPPHRPYDCAIELRAGAPLPSSTYRFPAVQPLQARVGGNGEIYKRVAGSWVGASLYLSFWCRIFFCEGGWHPPTFFLTIGV